MVIFWVIVGGIVGAIVMMTMAAQTQQPSAIGWVFIVLAVIGYLAFIIPAIAVTVRRLHDRGMSGWWYLGMVIASAVPIVGFLASSAFLVIMCLKGTDGDNRFGPDPLRPSGRADIFA